MTKRFDIMIDTVYNTAEFRDTKNNDKLICVCPLIFKKDLEKVLGELDDGI